MPSLSSVVKRFASTYQKTDGSTFKGTIFHADEGSLPSGGFNTERLLLRTSPNESLSAKDEFFDSFGRRFLVARHGAGQLEGSRLYKTWRLIQLTHEMTWEREDTILDALTGEKKATGMVNLGTVWGSFEPLGGGEGDGKISVRQQMHLVVTGSDVQLNDRLDNKLVRQIDESLGVYIVELQ